MSEPLYPAPLALDPAGRPTPSPCRPGGRARARCPDEPADQPELDLRPRRQRSSTAATATPAGARSRRRSAPSTAVAPSRSPRASPPPPRSPTSSRRAARSCSPRVTYYGVRNIFERMAGARAASTCASPPPDDTAAFLAAADGADMVWVESIANPLMVVADVPAIAAGARERGAITVVDATFATPLRQRPLDLGADIVMHSATKFIGGHSDLLLGAAVCRDEAHAAFLADVPPRPRGDPRRARGVPRAARPAHARGPARPGRGVGRRARPPPGGAPARVATVHYPGLPGDPQHERASRVLPRRLRADALVRGRRDRRADRCVPRRVCACSTHATSLGGVESLIERRARYAGDAAVVGPTLCRLSVGIENVEDLWADIDAALRAALA